jgi:uncharacterized cupin superfamily protein
VIVPEARLERTDVGVVPASDGWFVLNARDGRWRLWDRLGARLSVEGDTDFAQVGINLYVLGPGEPIGMYHWEATQEDFLVLSGEALLIVEGEERTLRQWDFVHCPRLTKHIIVGSGDGPCAVLAVGAREHPADEVWGGYPVDALAQRHGAGVDPATDDADVAYQNLSAREWASYRDGWLSG